MIPCTYKYNYSSHGSSKTRFKRKMTNSITKNIYFVRHGEGENNTAEVYLGSNAPLTNKGLDQVKALAERFSIMKVDAVITSSYKRALDTAQEIHKRIDKPLLVSDFFVEWGLPEDMFGLSFNDPKFKERDELISKAIFEGASPHPGDEGFDDLKNRSTRAISYIEERKEEDIVVVTHGIFYRFMVAHMCFGEMLTPQIFAKINKFMKTENTGITHIRMREGGKWDLWQWNDSAHLG